MDSMRLEWGWLLVLEQQRHVVPAASILWQDLATAPEHRAWVACALLSHPDARRQPLARATGVRGSASGNPRGQVFA
jgi:hypothetical protein